LRYRDTMLDEKIDTVAMLDLQTITVERIAEEDFVGMKDKWNELLEGSSTNDVFLTWEWMFSWWNTFKDDGKKLHILVGKDSQGRFIGIAPWYVERRNYLFGSKSRNSVRLNRT